MNARLENTIFYFLGCYRLQQLIRMNEVRNFVKSRRAETSLLKCTEYFNGTLHIAPDRTYHKLYHAGNTLHLFSFSLSFFISSSDHRPHHL